MSIITVFIVSGPNQRSTKSHCHLLHSLHVNLSPHNCGFPYNIVCQEGICRFYTKRKQGHKRSIDLHLMGFPQFPNIEKINLAGGFFWDTLYIALTYKMFLEQCYQLHNIVGLVSAHTFSRESLDMIKRPISNKKQNFVNLLSRHRTDNTCHVSRSE